MTRVPVTFILYTLEGLCKGELYPRLPSAARYVIAGIYIAVSLVVAVYMHLEDEAIGTLS
ncbi:MAG TPA: hypothetical protein VED01_02550 [Burkholderiales bacterium]|nr:hypothetical protein [Burkholderiales bacterium]